MFVLFHKGLHFSIEVTGGTVMEVNYPQAANIEGVRKTIETLGYNDSQVQSFGTARDVMIRLPAQSGVNTTQQSEKVVAALQAQEPGVVLADLDMVALQHWRSQLPALQHRVL